MFKRSRFAVEIILVCVRWYCKYGISYRDLAEMMQERGVDVDPSTIMRWVHRYAPEVERSGSSGTRGTLRPRGEWTRRMWRSVAT
jgi:transposase-like protein